MTSFFVALSLVAGAPAPKETPKAPPAKLDGEWVVEAIEGPPKDAPPGSVVMRFTDGKISIKEAKREKPEDASYTVDASKKPAQIDIRPDRAGGKDKVIFGIYEVTGDTLKLAFGFDGAERPTEFKGDVEKRIAFITLKRVKSEK